MSINIKEQLTYWLQVSNNDIETAKILYKNRKYLESLFFAHLSLEKILKAHFVALHREIPPFTHNLVLLAQKSNVVVEKDDLEFLAEMNRFQIEGQYPDFRYKLYKSLTKRESEMILKRVENLQLWLRKKLEEK